MKLFFDLENRQLIDVPGFRNAITSLKQEQIEWHLRLASLLAGLLVGILSLVPMMKKMRRR